MATQRVKNVCYCAEALINLADLKANEPYDALLLPKGASITSLLLEAQNTAGTGDVDVKLKAQNLNFLENATLDSSAKDTAFIHSSVHTVTSQADFIRIELASGQFTSGQARLKVVYFTPSQIVVEY